MEEDDEPVSTMHILQHANREGIPVYTINGENKEALDELDYDSDKISKFESYIDAGREITVPEEEVTISGWSGTGYIVMNEDGTAAYMISGGLAGGELSIPQIAALTVALVCFSILASFAVVYGIAYIVVPLAITATLYMTKHVLLAGPPTVYDIAKGEFIGDTIETISDRYINPKTERGKRIKNILDNILANVVDHFL